MQEKDKHMNEERYIFYKKFACNRCSGEGEIDRSCEDCGSCLQKCEECEGSGIQLDLNYIDKINSFIKQNYIPKSKIMKHCARIPKAVLADLEVSDKGLLLEVLLDIRDLLENTKSNTQFAFGTPTSITNGGEPCTNNDVGHTNDFCISHESDGSTYLSYPPQNRCKKCGQFYR